MGEEGVRERFVKGNVEIEMVGIQELKEGVHCAFLGVLC